MFKLMLNNEALESFETAQDAVEWTVRQTLIGALSGQDWTHTETFLWITADGCDVLEIINVSKTEELFLEAA